MIYADTNILVSLLAGDNGTAAAAAWWAAQVCSKTAAKARQRAFCDEGDRFQCITPADDAAHESVSTALALRECKFASS